MARRRSPTVCTVRALGPDPETLIDARTALADPTRSARRVKITADNPTSLRTAGARCRVPGASFLKSPGRSRLIRSIWPCGWLFCTILAVVVWGAINDLRRRVSAIEACTREREGTLPVARPAAPLATHAPVTIQPTQEPAPKAAPAPVLRSPGYSRPRSRRHRQSRPNVSNCCRGSQRRAVRGLGTGSRHELVEQDRRARHGHRGRALRAVRDRQGHADRPGVAMQLRRDDRHARVRRRVRAART